MKVEIKVCPIRDLDVWHFDLEVERGGVIFKTGWKAERSQIARASRPLTLFITLAEAFEQFAEDLRKEEGRWRTS